MSKTYTHFLKTTEKPIVQTQRGGVSLGERKMGEKRGTKSDRPEKERKK